MKAKELRTYTVGELEAKIQENTYRIAELKFVNRISPVEDPALIRNLRRDISRMNTLLTEKKRGIR